MAKVSKKKAVDLARTAANLVSAGRVAEALPRFEEAAAALPRAPVFAAWGDALMRLGRLAEAERAWAHGRDRYPDDPALCLRLGGARANAGDGRGALAMLRRAEPALADAPEVAGRYAALLAESGDVARAERVARRYEPSDPSRVASLVLATIALARGAFEDAAAHAERALAGPPEVNAAAHGALARSLALRGRYADAAAHFRARAASGPLDPADEPLARVAYAAAAPSPQGPPTEAPAAPAPKPATDADAEKALAVALGEAWGRCPEPLRAALRVAEKTFQTARATDLHPAAVAVLFAGALERALYLLVVRPFGEWLDRTGRRDAFLLGATREIRPGRREYFDNFAAAYDPKRPGRAPSLGEVARAFAKREEPHFGAFREFLAERVGRDKRALDTFAGFLRRAKETLRDPVAHGRAIDLGAEDLVRFRRELLESLAGGRCGALALLLAERR